METIKQLYLENFSWWLVIAPLVINAIWYPIELWLRIQEDKAIVEKKKNREGSYVYCSDMDFVSVGTLIWYAILIVVPFVNLIATVFDAAPSLMKRLYKRFEWLFQIKLVKLPKDKE